MASLCKLQVTPQRKMPMHKKYYGGAKLAPSLPKNPLPICDGDSAEKEAAASFSML